jgi:CheY-like chemotaxis protein
MAKVLLVDDDRALWPPSNPYSSRRAMPLPWPRTARRRRLPSESLDLLLTDLFMPEEDGIESFIEIRRSGNQSLRIIATLGGGGTAGRTLLDIAAEFGADVQLQKPITLKALVDAIRRCGL